MRRLTLSRLEVALVSASLAVAVCWVSGNLSPRFHYHAETVAQQQAILHGAPLSFNGAAGDLPEFHSRILVPALIGLGVATGIGSWSQWFIVWRLLTAAIMFAVLMELAARRTWPWSLLGALLLSSLLVLSFNHPWEHPTDFLDVAFTTAFCALAVRGRWTPLLLLAMVAAFNRDSAAFAGVVWGCVHGTAGRHRLRAWAAGAAISLAALAIVDTLRRVLAPAVSATGQTLAIRELPAFVSAFARHPTPYGWMGLLGASVALAGVAARHMPRGPVERRLLLAAGLVLAITLVFGMADEMRVYLPAFAIALFALLSGAAGQDDPAALRAG